MSENLELFRAMTIEEVQESRELRGYYYYYYSDLGAMLAAASDYYD